MRSAPPRSRRDHECRAACRRGPRDSAVPPAFVASTGRPEESASSTTFGRPSRRLVSSSTSAAPYHFARRSGSASPASARALRASVPRCARPAPRSTARGRRTRGVRRGACARVPRRPRAPATVLAFDQASDDEHELPLAEPQFLATVRLIALDTRHRRRWRRAPRFSRHRACPCAVDEVLRHGTPVPSGTRPRARREPRFTRDLTRRCRDR